jgi:hypothetical protein
MFYAVRIIKQMVEVDYFGEKQFVPEYEYFCYCSNLKGLDALQLHTLYGSRSESENWIEQTKNSLCAGKTITHDFWGKRYSLATFVICLQFIGAHAIPGRLLGLASRALYLPRMVYPSAGKSGEIRQAGHGKNA